MGGSFVIRRWAWRSLHRDSGSGGSGGSGAGFVPACSSAHCARSQFRWQA